jgi:hypothetical protein
MTGGVDADQIAEARAQHGRLRWARTVEAKYHGIPPDDRGGQS